MLLPGVLFFIGLQIPEKFSRDAVDRSALGQLAGVLLISLIVHGAVFLAWSVVSQFQPSVPRIDVGMFLLAMSADVRDPAFRESLTGALTTRGGWVLLHLVVAATFGVLLGWAMGARIVAGGLRFLTQHRWVYELSIGDQLTTAWVMTNVRHDSKVLMYRGFLNAIHLKRDGTFSYIVLTHVAKGYLTLTADVPVASAADDWRGLGASTRASEAGQSTRSSKYQGSHFVIEGEDVANVVFDRYEIDFPAELRSMKRDQQLEDAFRVAIEDLEIARGEAIPASGSNDSDVSRQDQSADPEQRRP